MMKIIKNKEPRPIYDFEEYGNCCFPTYGDRIYGFVYRMRHDHCYADMGKCIAVKYGDDLYVIDRYEYYILSMREKLPFNKIIEVLSV